MRASYAFFLFILLCLAAVSALTVSARSDISSFQNTGRDLKEIVSLLRLTDISFTTDARYTRNPSQADLFSAFQDYPGSIEHFPSGSVTAPPDFGSFGTVLTVRK